MTTRERKYIANKKSKRIRKRFREAVLKEANQNIFPFNGLQDYLCTVFGACID